MGNDKGPPPGSVSDEAIRWNRTLDEANGPGAGAGSYAEYNPGFSAFQLFNQRLNPIFASTKSGQNFAKYATEFEKTHSSLTRNNYNFDPVVDKNYLVIGHIGRIRGDFFWEPMGLGAGNVQESFNAGHPVFVYEHWDLDQKLWRIIGTTDEDWLVFVRIDGGLVKVLGGRARANIEDSAIQVADLYFIGKAIIDLGAGLGKRLVSSVLSKEEASVGRVVLEGPSAMVAKQAVEDAVADEVAARSNTYIPKSGISRAHYKAFQDAAREVKVVALVRNGKESAIPLIEKGCPGKPKIFEPFNTDATTGILTASKESDKQLVYKSKYILVDDQRVAHRMLANGQLEKVELRNVFWQLQPGQVIDPALLKPVVGDYDLMGVFSPLNPGQNITLVSVNGLKVENMTSPIVEKFGASANARFDMKRILHGAQDQYSGFRKGATAFFPDGTVVYMDTEEEVKAFYDSVGRQPIKGAYPKPTQVNPNPDIGPGGRKK